MIQKKIFEVTAKDIDSVVVELAKEIENGWTIDSICSDNMTFECHPFTEFWPTFKVIFVRKK